MTNTTFHRKRPGHRLFQILAAMLITLILLPGVAAGMQRIPEPTEEPAAGSSPVFLDDKLRDKLKDLPSDTGDGTEGTSEETAVVDAEGGSFVDSTFGFTVEFSGPWNHTGSYEENGITTEHLEIRGEQGGIYVTAYEWTGEYAVRDYIQWWATVEYSEEWLPGGEPLRYVTSGSKGAVIHISEPTDEYPERWVYVTELHAFDSYAVEIVHFAPLSTFESSYTSAAGAVFADGTPLLGQFAYDEIEALLPAN